MFAAGTVLLATGERGIAEALYLKGKAYADQTRLPATSASAIRADVVIATIDGRLQEALAIGERLEEGAAELGIATVGHRYRALSTRPAALYSGEADAALAQLDQGNLASIEGDSPQLEVQRALCLAHLDRTQEARQLLAAFMEATGIDDESPTWLLTYCLELAVLLEDKVLAATIVPRLDPVAAMFPFGGGFFHTCIARHLGAAAALLGNREQAEAYYATGLELCGKIRHRPEIALTRLQLAELLLAYPDERAAAIGHLDFAVAEFREMRMQPSLERALRHREVLKA
jgi:hypothetical protein